MSRLGAALCCVVSLACTHCAATLEIEDRPPVETEQQAPPGRLAADLGIPPGHLPPPGQCKIWHPGTPPGQQRGHGDCGTLRRQLPAGAWLVERREDEDTVRVSVGDAERSGKIVAVRIYELKSGRFVREEP